MPRQFKKILFLFAALLLLPGLARAEMVYNRGNSGEPATLDPHKMSTVQESHIGRDMWEGLLQFGAQGNAIPGMATSWTLSDDGPPCKPHRPDGPPSETLHKYRP